MRAHGYKPHDAHAAGQAARSHAEPLPLLPAGQTAFGQPQLGTTMTSTILMIMPNTNCNLAPWIEMSAHMQSRRR